jgi:hypothetical protein
MSVAYQQVDLGLSNSNTVAHRSYYSHPVSLTGIVVASMAIHSEGIP